MSASLAPLDFRDLMSQKGYTSVQLQRSGVRTDWILAGPTSLHYTENIDLWRLDGRYENVTDYEHSSALAFRLPLVGVRMERVDSGVMYLVGRIAMDDYALDDFRVPDSAPKHTRDLPDFGPCKERDCRGAGAHCLTSRYCPEKNEALFELVKGVRVQIRTGVNWER